MGATGSKAPAVQLVSAGRDTTCKVWDLETGKCCKIISEHAGPVTAVASTSSAEGGMLKAQFASAGRDGKIFLYSPAYELLHTLVGHTAEVTTVVYGPIGNLMASGSKDNSIVIWTSEGVEKCKMRSHSGEVNALAFSPSGTKLLSGSTDQSVRVWDVANGKCKFMVRNFKAWINSVAWSPDGKLIATGEKETSVKLFNATDGRFVSELTTAYSAGLAFAPQGDLLAAGDKHVVNLWNTSSGHLVQTLVGHTAAVTCIEFNATGTAIASSSADATVRIFDSFTGECVKIFKAHASEVSAVCWFAPRGIDGDLEAGGADEGIVGKQDSPLKRTYSTRQFKVLVVGDVGAGKTSLVRQSCDGYFSDKYKATIGVDFAVKKVAVSGGFATRLALWDIAGQERNGTMTRVYFKGATAALVVVDATRIGALDGALAWKKDIVSKVAQPNGLPIPVMLLANKCDLSDKIAMEETVLNDFCKEHGFAAWLYTSAKDNVNIDEYSKLVVQQIMGRIDAAADNDADASVDGGFTVGAPPERSVADQCCQ